MLRIAVRLGEPRSRVGTRIRERGAKRLECGEPSPLSLRRGAPGCAGAWTKEWAMLRIAVRLESRAPGSAPESESEPRSAALSSARSAGLCWRVVGSGTI
jgi:hypothetical protein